MKIVIMNSSDIEGGAARCAYRLHKGLQSSGTESIYFVQNKFSTDEDIQTSSQASYIKLVSALRGGLDKLPLLLYRKRKKSYFSTGLVTTFNTSPINTLSPDIINLHYVTEGFLPIRSLKKMNKPIVWTFHDSWPFTGGCHLPGNCKRYEGSCGACPILGSEHPHDLSHWIWKKKFNNWHELNLTVITDSTWLAGCVRESSLFRDCRIEAINPGLDLTRYRPIDKKLARSLLSFPQDKKMILFGAMHSTSDPNKGFQFLQPAIQNLAKTPLGSQTELVVFGASEPRCPPDFGMPIHYMGRLNDDISLPILYSSADVMVVPSIRESFGQTASEALACGVPVVAFGATGLLDIVDHKISGYLANPYSYEDLGKGLEWVLTQNEREALELSSNARKKAESAFSIELMTSKYLSLFNELITTDASTRS